MKNEGVKDPLEGVELLPWQRTLRDALHGEPEEDGPILWYRTSRRDLWSKCDFFKSCLLNSPETMFGMDRTTKAFKRGLRRRVKEKRSPRVILIDIATLSRVRFDWEFVEGLRRGEGFYLDGRLHRMPAPHVVVFCPDKPKLSDLPSPAMWQIQALNAEGSDEEYARLTGKSTESADV